MNAKTLQITTNTTVRVSLAGQHFSVANYTPSNIFVSVTAPSSADENLIPDADGVIRILSSSQTVIPECNGNLYVYSPMGGRVEICASDCFIP